MAHIRSREARAALVRKGFREEQKKGADHYYYRLYVDGAKTAIFTKISHGAGSEDLRSGLVGQMAKQLKIGKDDFLRLVECTLDADGLLALLKAKGEIP